MQMLKFIISYQSIKGGIPKPIQIPDSCIIKFLENSLYCGLIRLGKASQEHTQEMIYGEKLICTDMILLKRMYQRQREEIIL
jgi:hypothetical protein